MPWVEVPWVLGCQRDEEGGEETGERKMVPNGAGEQVWQEQAYITSGQILWVRMRCVLGCKYRGV